jgi:hypothetical protein
MKLDEAIRCAAQESNMIDRARRVEEVVNFMRFRLGWNHAQAARAAEKSGLSTGHWEELLYEVDQYCGQRG